MSTPDKPGSRALAALDTLLAESVWAEPAPALDVEHAKACRVSTAGQVMCDLCGSPELCARCVSGVRSSPGSGRTPDVPAPPE